MNRTALKSYAPKARLDFIRAITDRAAFFGLTPERTEPMQETGDVVIIGGRAFPKVVASQRRSLEARVKDHGFAQVMEAMGYTWFNRFVALRYMELHGYLEHGYRVLSHPEGKPTPEILEHAEHVTLPGLDPQKVIELKLHGGKDAELYRLLLVAQCNALHEAMPFLFEKIADETELLLPDNLLHSDSLIRQLVTELDEADWQQVEIIGWLYQFYISDKKDEVIGKVVKSEDIPAATQLFTPNWIVKYLVQNTLGRQWLATYPDSPLRQQMEYYIAPAAQTDDVQAQLAAITPKSLDPETLTLLDPASGSGHILVEAYDLFKAIYQERGYRSKDIPRLILEKNLFGLEIDDRAAQLAAFALLMKARADDRRIFADHVQPNVIAIQESKGLEHLLRPDPAAAKGVGELPFADSDLFPQTEKQLTLTKPNQESPLAAVEPCLRELIKLFEHGKTFGSLIRVPPELAAQLPAARQGIEAMLATGQLWEHRAATIMLPLVKQAELLAKQYDFAVANPPYMGRKYQCDEIEEFLAIHYSDYSSDLYAAFICRCMAFCRPTGIVAMITMDSWMFGEDFSDARSDVLQRASIIVNAHLGPRAFDEISGEVVQTCAFALRPVVSTRNVGAYFKLTAPKTSEGKRILLLSGSTRFDVDTAFFDGFPRKSMAYFASPATRDTFVNGKRLADFAEAFTGLQTGDNPRFIRGWSEVSVSNIAFGVTANSTAGHRERWFPYVKGSEYRKWYGNLFFVVNWEHGGAAIRSHPSATVRNSAYYFMSGLAFNNIATKFSARFVDGGAVFDQKNSMIIPKNEKFLLGTLGFLHSIVIDPLLEVAAQKGFGTGNLKVIPVDPTFLLNSTVSSNVEELVAIARKDWDSFETSWHFGRHPLINGSASSTLSASWTNWSETCDMAWRKTKELEEGNNQLFISAYGLFGKIAPEVPDDLITLSRADREDTMQRLISYAIGCMMGRYSLDKPGLVYAHSRNEGFDASKYQTFPADPDGILPITELAWFPDDATERFVEFIGKAWPAEHLEENLKFIADSLGANRDEHPRDTIRRYLSQNFYKDHLQTYKRRPIYWLFSSGKQKAFSCLVYLHRYHEGTLARMRTEYVIPLQGKLSQRIEQLAGDSTAATSTSHRRKLEKERETLVKQRTELAAFDEKLRHYADQRIALDLDDGVKVNYAKFGDLLAEVKAVTGGAEE